jgi:hypothetical protein
MGIRFSAATALASAAIIAGLIGPASANYRIRTLTNLTNQTVSISFPIGPNGGRGSSTFVSGDMIVAIPGQGIVTFRDMGHNTRCAHPYWGVSIKYKDQQWGFFYDGGGELDMTINANGSLAFPAGLIVNGSGPPPCH